MQKGWSRKHLPIVFVFFSGLVLSLGISQLIREQENHQHELHIEKEANSQISALKLGMEDKINLLTAVQAFFDSSEEVDRDEFKIFSRQFLINNPMVQAISWVPIVMEKDREAFEARARRDGVTGFQFYEIGPDGQKRRAGKRPVYYPVFYGEREDRPSPALGFDMGSRENRLAMFERALRLKSPVTSGKITLITDTGRTDGFILANPIFKNGRAIGFALAILNLKDLVEGSLFKFDPRPDTNFKITLIEKGPTREEAILYSSLPKDSRKPFHQSRDAFKFADSEMEIQMAAFEPFHPPFWRGGFSAFIIGLIITLMICGYFILQIRKGKEIEEKVQFQTRRLREWGEKLEKTQGQLAASQEQLKLALGVGQIGVWRWDCVLDILEWDDEMFVVFNRKREDFTGKYEFFHQSLHPEDADRVNREVQAALKGKAIFNNEFRAIGKDGEVRHIYARGSGTYDSQGNLVSMAGINMDITEKKNAEEKLRREEHRFRMIIEQVPAIVWSVDRDLVITSSVGSGLTALGHRNHELEGMTLWEYIQSDDENDPTVEAVRRAMRGKTVVQESRFKDIFFQSRFQPLRDENGEITGVTALSLNVTDVRKLQDQLRQSQKMESVGQLAGGIAHDFNNILNVILGYAQCVHESLPEKDPNREDMVEIRKAAERAAGLTARLLAFSRRQTLQPQVISLNAEIRDMNKMLVPLVGENIQWETALDPAAGSIFADPGPIQQVITNLVVNARDAMPDGGTLKVETGMVAVDASWDSDPLPPGDYVTLSVKDTGTGMTESVKSQVFEPFFTTKEVGKGSGLGLSMVYGVVKQSGGFIFLDSEVGVGTKVTIYFPKAEGKPELAGVQPEFEEPDIEGTESILVIEDESPVRRLVSRILTKRGFTVHSAANGDEAIKILESVKGKVDLILSDVVLPDTRGDELSHKIHSRYPGLRFVFMSGYLDSQNGSFSIDESVPFLQKPFTPSVLLEKIRGTLDKAA